MMCGHFELRFPDDPDYEDLLAEIYIDDEFVGQISQEAGFDSLDFEIHPQKNGEPWRFKLKDFEETIQKAKTRLWELRKTNG